jgi:integrase
MSVHKTKTGYVVRWRDGARNRQRTFDRHADARRWDDEVRRRRQLGTLAQLDAGVVTLNAYVIDTWTAVYAPMLAPRTREVYAHTFDRHIAPTLGALAVHTITPAVVARWQAAVAPAGREALAKARTVLSSILSTAAEVELIATNPLRTVRAPRAPMHAEVRPLAPASVEALRAALGHRDAVLVSLMAYAGLRPGEARELRWGHVLDRTLVIGASKTGKRRTVRLLDPLATDLRERRMASGRPADDAPVIPRPSDGGVMSARSFNDWRGATFGPALAAAGLPPARPYDLRHSFASLLLHEGRSVIYVARQLGHDARYTLGTYGHVIDELDGQPHVSAEDAIVRRASRRRQARLGLRRTARHKGGNDEAERRRPGVPRPRGVGAIRDGFGAGTSTRDRGRRGPDRQRLHRFQGGGDDRGGARLQDRPPNQEGQRSDVRRPGEAGALRAGRGDVT